MKGDCPNSAPAAISPPWATPVTFDFLQSSRQVADPGTYNVTVRVCTGEALGSDFTCQEKDAGPDITMYGMAPEQSR